MNYQSSPRSTQRQLSQTRNIKLRLKSKLIPEDFFSQSFSINSGKKSKCQTDSVRLIPVKKISCRQQNSKEKYPTSDQTKQLAIIKRLYKIKQKSSIQPQNQKKIIKRIMSRQKFDQKKQIENKKKKGYSKRVMQYMQKMKNFINIDIDMAFVEDNLETHKEMQKKISTYTESEHNDPVKRIKQRPKSEINSRQRLISKKKLLNQVQKIVTKVKVRDVNKLMRSSQQFKQKDNRYNKFIDIALDQDGLLTFYNSPDMKQRHSESKSIKTSLPKLRK